MMSPPSQHPPPCEFQSDKLVLAIDELVPSKIEAISPVVDGIMKLIHASGCAPQEPFDVETALREALANAVIHGNHKDPEKMVRICCACQPDRGILIIVKDEGEGFDPATVSDPLVGQNLYADHGRGVFLINHLMDAVEYKVHGTEIHMRKSCTTV